MEERGTEFLVGHLYLLLGVRSVILLCRKKETIMSETERRLLLYKCGVYLASRAVNKSLVPSYKEVFLPPP